MVREDRYVFRPVALCSVLTASGVLVLLSGLKQIMRLDGAWMLLGIALLIAAGFMFTGVYVLSRCAVILDDQGVRVRGSTGDWQEIRWPEVTAVVQETVPRRGRTGGSTMLRLQGRNGEAVEVIRNERTLALIQRYSPVSITYSAE